ncbi:helix-turn-helix domain-containing protein [Coleofasciculus sp. FACHB-129]|uniref:helix-turn-helix domain-containing protein n=1 Tax=Cyanophyceae TaxID=3028117 RepID=UPI0016870282|nr:helix-turn-helix domain-containing protein [Coleofasciculus sp. FACHB-129]MBD1893729.1 helix-turn-helix domain-containing protein [Coleofasciculus sp. FACHB-129]
MHARERSHKFGFPQARSTRKVMALQSAYGSGITESPTIEISQEVLRSILSRIESELHSSEVYNRALAGLQTILGEAAGSAQIMVKAVGREAIRLAFQQFAKTYKVVPVTSPEIGNNQQEPQASTQPQESSVHSEQPSVNHPESATNDLTLTNDQGRSMNASPADLVDIRPLPVPTSPDPVFPKPLKKLSKAELAAQIADEQRQECLRQIGQQLGQARHAQSMTLRQLHNQTLVPLHHIQALEVGCFEHLPEDIYVRGFIRRMGVALGLDGAAMAASLPAPDPAKSVLPSWYRPKSVPGFGFQLNTVHLYVGYAALVAGAVGGLALMSNHSQSSASADSPPDVPNNSSASESHRPVKPAAKPGLKAGQKGVAVGPDIAPPEAISRN